MNNIENTTTERYPDVSPDLSSDENSKLTSTGNFDATPTELEPAYEKRCCCSRKRRICKMAFQAAIVIAIVGLYVLYFTNGAKKPAANNSNIVQNAISYSGEIVYINIDTINSNYTLMKILRDDIDKEMTKQEALFRNRKTALENKYSLFQKNYQANILTPAQIENTQQQLVAEGQQLQEEYQNVMTNLEMRSTAALQQVVDSLIQATHRINKTQNASFIFTYQTGGPLLEADPSKDITTEVLKELNQHFANKKGK